MSLTRSTPAPAALALAALLAACGRTDAPSGAPSAESHAPGTTAASVPGPCSGYPKGSAGVLNTYCDGPAVVKLSIGAKTYVLHGGACARDAGQFSLNLGVVSTDELAGPKPDFIGLNTSDAQGPFTDATLAVTVDGKTYPLPANDGELDAHGGAFEGADSADGVKISGSFTC